MSINLKYLIFLFPFAAVFAEVEEQYQAEQCDQLVDLNEGDVESTEIETEVEELRYPRAVSGSIEPSKKKRVLAVFAQFEKRNQLESSHDSTYISENVPRSSEVSVEVGKYSVPETLRYSSDEIESYAPSKKQGGMAVLEAHRITVLSALVRSPVAKIHKQMGDQFEEDEVLIELDNKEYDIQYAKAKALLKRNSALYDNKKKLYDQNIVSLSEVVEAEANQEVAKADFDQAQLNLENTVVKAPYAGKVKKVYLQEGELAKYGSELIEIISDKKLVANILLPASYKGKIQRGDLFKVSFQESDQPVEAVVERVSQVVDPASGTIKVEASIENPDTTLHSGMTGWAVPEKQ